MTMKRTIGIASGIVTIGLGVGAYIFWGGAFVEKASAASETVEHVKEEVHALTVDHADTKARVTAIEKMSADQAKIMNDGFRDTLKVVRDTNKRIDTFFDHGH